MESLLIPISLPAGIYQNGTVYQSSGRWYNANLVRFFENTIRPVGGWQRTVGSTGSNLNALSGMPRGCLAWRFKDSTPLVAFGTTTHLYVLDGGVVYDISPTTLQTGIADATYESGQGTYGSLNYSQGPWGIGVLGQVLEDATVWSMDQWNGNLVAVSTADTNLYMWQGATGTPAAVIPNSPPCTGVVVTGEARQIMALCAGGDVRTIAWCDQQDSTQWAPGPATTAGFIQLATVGQIMCAKRTSQQTIIWTDVDVWALTYIGGTLQYSFAQVGDKCGIISRSAAVLANNTAYWMGRTEFYTYAGGQVVPLSCDVTDFLFANLNSVQKSKIWGIANPQYNEVTWFFPSAGSIEIDSYVTYNYAEGQWSVGRLNRTCGSEAGVLNNQIMVSPTGFIYDHETGFVHQDSDGSALTPFLESGPIEVGSGDLMGYGARHRGDQIMKILRLVPDEKTLGNVNLSVYTQFYPTDTPVVNGPYSLAAPTSVRLTARQIQLLFQEVVATDWRIGTMRLGMKPGGKR